MPFSLPFRRNHERDRRTLRHWAKETGMDITLSASGGRRPFRSEGRNLLIQWIEATHSFIVYVEVGALGGWRNGEICRLLLASNFLSRQARSLQPPAWWGWNFPIPAYGLDTGDFLKTVNNIVLFSGNMESPPRRHEQRTGSPYGTGAASRPEGGKPGAVFHRRAIPPASRAFQKCPNAGISGAPQYGVHPAENDIDAQESPKRRAVQGNRSQLYRTPHLVSAIGGRMPVFPSWFFNNSQHGWRFRVSFLQNGGEPSASSLAARESLKLSRSARGQRNPLPVLHS